jgi:hypothetical protein
MFTSEKLTEHRPRAVVATMGLLALFLSVLFFMPVPRTTLAQGVVWVPEQSQIYVETDGFVSDILVPSGTQVEPGTLLIKMRSPTLNKKIVLLEAESLIINIQIAQALQDNPVQKEIIAEQATLIAAELLQLHQQREALTLRSSTSGTFVIPDGKQLNEQYLQQGALIGYVINPERIIIRTVITQDDISLVIEHNEEIQVRLAERLNDVVDGQIIRMTPAGSKMLPTLALSVEGGGKVTMERGANGNVSAKEAMFQLDLFLPKGLVVSGLGGRAYVRFEHGNEPLALQWLRSGRQLLLSQL